MLPKSTDNDERVLNMSYFQTDDIPQYPHGEPRSLLTLTNPIGEILLEAVKSHVIRAYFKDMYLNNQGNGKRIWREELTKLGYKIENALR
jgi:hypothetical protein